MNVLNEKKGFTLIELLAVIVVLAIVMVLAATTVLPYMANAGRQAFATEAETIKKSASQAVSLISIGSITSNYKTKTDSNGNATGYCFTVADLKTLGLFDKEETYIGIVEVSKEENAYTYTVKMKSSKYYVSKSGKIETTDVEDVTTDPVAPLEDTVPEGCSNEYK